MIKIHSIMIAVMTMAPTLASANIDLTHIPLGDGHLSLTSPKVGYVYSCMTPNDKGGAMSNTPWIHGDTWDLTQKVSVSGNIAWPNAKVDIGGDSNTRTITSNDLPQNGTTGNFPVSYYDKAYSYDSNPNTISPQKINISIPRNPIIATSPSCVPMGKIAIGINGVAIFNALDGQGRDAVAHEVQDSCNGHPERTGEYHYHGKSSCITGTDKPDQIIAYAFDGFSITSGIKSDGTRYMNGDLDVCHGTTSPIMWDGAMKTVYHYVLTDEYPYSVGCFRGTPSTINFMHPGDDHNEGHTGNDMMSTGTPVMRERPDDSTASACDITTSGTSSSRSIGRGERGAMVALIQSFLVKLGFLQMPAGANPGYFGKATEDALKQYQTQNNLPPVGLFGPRTRGEIGKRCPPGIRKQLENGDFPPGLIGGPREGDDQGRWMASATPPMPRPNERMGPPPRDDHGY